MNDLGAKPNTAARPTFFAQLRLMIGLKPRPALMSTQLGMENSDCVIRALFTHSVFVTQTTTQPNTVAEVNRNREAMY